MDDNGILDLFFARDEAAIAATAAKYGAYCFAIAGNILPSREDAEECVNDTWLRAWEAIPPKRPSAFRVYLGKIARNLSLDRYKWLKRKKRGDETARLFAELDECVLEAMRYGASASAEAEFETAYESAQVEATINTSLRGMSQDARMIFIRRYYHAEAVSEIAARFKMSESKVKTTLYRARQKLKAELEGEGVHI